MSTIPTYDPMTSDARSSWLAGLTEACNKISGTLNMKTSTFENLTLPELYISDEDRFRIYQAPLGNKLWIANPAPVIKKNGVVITPTNDHFSIDYLGGSIAFEDGYVLTENDVVTASATYIVDGSGQIDTLIEQIEAISTEAGRNKGAYDSLTSLQAAYPTATAGDFAIVTDEDTIYIWDVESSSWVNIHKDVDLSAYYTSAQTDNLLNGKEDSISAHGTTVASDNYYYGGRKTWVDLLSKIRSFALTGLVTSDDSVVTAADTLLVAVGKLQAQISGFEPYIKGTSAPTTSTVGKIGQDYINTSNGDKYHLVSIDDSIYTWEKYGAGDVMQADLDDLDYVKTSGDAMTGALNMGGNKVTSVGEGTADSDAATIAQLTARIEALEAKLTPSITAASEAAEAASTAAAEAKTTADNAQTVASGCLPLSGGTMTGPIYSTSSSVVQYGDASNASGGIGVSHCGLILKNNSANENGDRDCINFQNLVLQDQRQVWINADGSTPSVQQAVRLVNIKQPVNDLDAANKQYVDSKTSGLNPNPSIYITGDQIISTSNGKTKIAVATSDVIFCVLFFKGYNGYNDSYIPQPFFVKKGSYCNVNYVNSSSISYRIDYDKSTLVYITGSSSNSQTIRFMVQQL